MLVLIFLLCLVISFAGIIIIVFRKVPVLLNLPQNNSSQKTVKSILIGFVKKIKNKTPFEKFSGELFLQKVLSKTRVLILKIDNKTFHWLVSLREKAQKNKFAENDNYWKGIKDRASIAGSGKEDNVFPASQKISKEKRPRKKRLPVQRNPV